MIISSQILFLFYFLLILDPLRESTMGEDDIVEHSWKSGQVVRSSQTQSQRPTSDSSSHPPIHRGSGEENALLPLPLPPPPPPLHHLDLFIQEDEMASRLYQDYICSEQLVYSTLATHSPSSSAPYGQIMNFSRLRGNIFTGGRVEAGPSMPVCSSAPTESYLTPAATHGTESRAMVTGGVSSTFTVPGRGRKEKAVAIQTETETADDRKRKEREAGMKETEEAGDLTSKKRSRAAEMHNLSERRRRERINEKMKALQELIPRCNKSDKASMLDDAIEYMKSLQMQIQMMSTGCGMMYAENMQRLMMMGMNRPPIFIPFPRPAHMTGLGSSYPAPPYPSPNIQASDPSRVHLQSPQPGSNQVSNQPQLLTYMNPYSQFVGLHHMQQAPPPIQTRTTLQLNFSQASSSKDPEDQDNQPTG